MVIVAVSDGGHQRTRPHQEGAGRRAGMIMQAEDRVAGKSIEKPVCDHSLGAAALACFLGRLEDQIDRAVEMARARQIFGCAEQHRRVAVMAAGMHLAGGRAGVGQARSLP